jgi:outer membrane protein, heavy metal efflux system
MDVVIRRLRVSNADRSPNSLAAAAQIATLVFALGLVSGPSPAQPPSPGASVEELLAIALERTPELAVMRLEAEAVAERIGPSSAFPDPMFRVELQDIDNDGRGFPTLLPSRVGATKYTFVQSLPWFGKRDLRRSGAEADAEAARLRIDDTWAEVAMRVKTAYAQYWQVVHTERLVRDVLDLMARLEEIAQARYAGGLAAQQDAIRAQTERTAMEGELILLAGERRRVIASLNAVLVRPATAPLAEPERIRALPAVAALDIAMLADRLVARNPALAVEAARITSAERARDLAYRNRLPDVSIGVSPIQVGSRIAEWELMLEVTIPLQQNVKRSQEREAERMRDAAVARKATAFVRLQGELGSAVAALETARQTEALIASRLLPLAQINFESALAGYENGKIDFAALLEAQRQIRKARQDIVKAQAEQQMRLAELERIVGEDL